ncbi:MAG TPA: hypothetical protein VF798_08340 [Burkholderiaceae bacterium]
MNQGELVPVAGYPKRDLLRFEPRRSDQPFRRASAIFVDQYEMIDRKMASMYQLHGSLFLFG